MNIISQYIAQIGISGDILALILSIPIILIVILVARRMIGLTTLDLYLSVALTILFSLFGIKKGAFLFLSVFLLMIIVRHFLKRIKFLSISDAFILESLVFSTMIFVFITILIFIQPIKTILFDPLILMAIFIISLCSDRLIGVWEAKKFKKFINYFIEFSIVIISSYFIVNWSFIKGLTLQYPISTILISVFIIILLANYRGLKIKEFIEFKEVIKHVEPSSKK